MDLEKKGEALSPPPPVTDIHLEKKGEAVSRPSFIINQKHDLSRHHTEGFLAYFNVPSGP